MLKIAMRNAGRVVFIDVAGEPDMWALVRLHVRSAIFKPALELRLKSTGQQVSMYVDKQSSLVHLTKPNTGSGCGINISDDGRVITAGTGGHYDLLMIEPKYHPESAQVLAEHRESERIKEQKREQEEIREQALREIVDRLIDQIGYDEAIRRLQQN